MLPKTYKASTVSRYGSTFLKPLTRPSTARRGRVLPPSIRRFLFKSRLYSPEHVAQCAREIKLNLATRGAKSQEILDEAAAAAEGEVGGGGGAEGGGAHGGSNGGGGGGVAGRSAGGDAGGG